MNCQSKVCLNNLLARSAVIRQWNFSSFSTDEGRRLTRNEIKYFSAILGVPVNASEDRIKQAFYMKSKESHPDINKEEGSSRLFSEITQAYKALVYDKKFSENSLKNNNIQNVATHIRPWVQPRKKKEPNSNRSTSTAVDSDESYQSVPKPTSSSQFCDAAYMTMLQRDAKAHAAKKIMKTEDNNKSCKLQ